MDIDTYIRQINEDLQTGHAREHAYRPALVQFMNSIDGVQTINDPKRSEHGNPDLAFLSDTDKDIILGYAEAKDLSVNLNKVENSEQMRRYAGYDNLYLTNYIEFRFFKNGEKYQTIEIAKIADGELKYIPENFERLLNELKAFIEQKPERIRSSKRLAQIMGGKARRIRDNVFLFIQKGDDERNQELERIYGMMKAILVNDLSEDDFANMYAQTLVYGLFIARYNDKTPEDFTRQEARDLVPRSNPFLQKFFDHIVGPDFDKRLVYIVDELCDAFRVSDVKELVHEHLRGLEQSADDKDPVIYFYEDFLKEYDPALRKRMGAYYTPVPIVRFMVKQVDEILKKDFGIKQGLADASRHDTNSRRKTYHRVQILDPAVGTATFINEIIKYIYQSFKGQEGRWPAYVKEDLMPRLYGFELMMAPYTVAHLKLGMTLMETGINDFGTRLGVYLTNSLEPGLLAEKKVDFGLAHAVSEENRIASEIKTKKPIMVIIGNPPYSGHSSNDTEYANGLIEKYRVEPGGRQRLRERNSKYLKDDYVKFIAMAEEMIKDNREGILAMITNNGYIDNPTFRGMRWHLSNTFDKIKILDLHGSLKKQETTPEGDRDENVFDIEQGVAILLAVKTSNLAKSLEASPPKELTMGIQDDAYPAQILHSELYGKRSQKFKMLENKIQWTEFQVDPGHYTYVPLKNPKLRKEYNAFVFLPDLFKDGTHGFKTHRDAFAVAHNPKIIDERIEDFLSDQPDAALQEKYNLPSKGVWHIARARERLRNQSIQERSAYIVPCLYRPFDAMFTYLDEVVSNRPRALFKAHILGKDNLILGVGRQGLAVGGIRWCLVIASRYAIDTNVFRRGGVMAYPLYLYAHDKRYPNLDEGQLQKLLQNIKPYNLTHSQPAHTMAEHEITPEDVFDYIYAILHSVHYREKYREFLRNEFPRIPIPKDKKSFLKFRNLGKMLRDVHLMEAGHLQSATTFPITGSNVVDKIEYRGGNAWINANQYFGSIPEATWGFFVGGYQPAQKWLKDRKGKELSNIEIEYYQKVIAAIVETIRLMQKIDQAWQL